MSAAFRNMSVLAIAAALSFALIACGDDSSSASNDDTPVSSSEENEILSSASADSSNLLYGLLCADTLNTDGRYFTTADGYYKCANNKWSYVENEVISLGAVIIDGYTKERPEWKLKKCTDANEGVVQAAWNGNIKYGGEIYFKCQNGSWVEGDIRLTCDTTGAQVGDICRKSANTGYFDKPSEQDLVRFYVYAGDGVWESYDPKAEITEECNLNNSGLLIWRVLDELLGKKDTVLYECRGLYVNNNGDVDDRSSWYMRITGLNLEDVTPGCVSEKPAEGDTCLFRDNKATQYNYRYKDGKWVGWDIAEENCATENVATGDTCSFEWLGEMKYYMYVDDYWKVAVYDSKLGYCAKGVERYVDSDGEYFSCENGQWEQVDLAPGQFTDPQKDSLTDEEFDTLDLPKDAEVVDHIGGLLAGS